MERIIIGTAGHVDHGKTILTRRLTGIDTDRLKEEKKRGISIELGFAPLTLPSGTKVGLVDVPGHERFIKNMLAGIAGIDLVLLVIAADEGVMPQTREHLDIINLLEVKKGIVVVTKSDLVDEEWLELVKGEIEEVLAGTVLEKAPMVAVSAMTGHGIPQLMEVIDKIARETPPKTVTGKMRIPVDRVFTITGFGTVITGTLWSGRLKVGETVEILPQNLSARVRNVQVHGEKVPEATAGQRVAVNLAGVETEEISRGDVLAEPGLLEASHRIDVKLNLLKHTDIPLEQRARVRIHHGTREVLGRVNLLDREELLPGDSCFCQLVLETPLMALREDHFVIRSYSPMITIGGGIIIDPLPARHKRYKESVIKNLEVRSKGNPQELIIQTIGADQVGLLTQKAISAGTGLDEALVKDELINLNETGQIVSIDGEGTAYYLLKEQEDEWLTKIKNRLADYHRKFPLRPGMPKEELRSRDFSQITGKVFHLLLEHWAEKNEFRLENQNIAARDFKAEVTSDVAKAIQLIEQGLLKEPFSPPSWDELAQTAGISGETKNEIYLWLLNSQRIVKLSDEVIISGQALAEAKEKIGSFIKGNGSIQLAETRDLLNTSRKYALPLLEYLDQVKFTRRKGDMRVLY
ncbi:MAG: selenocysteine-specific translation elongation factor [Bacillota bacterium]|jgi:selenocysteine-specific elongation factor